MGKNYKIELLTLGQCRGYGYTCNLCGAQEIGTDLPDAYFVAARHVRKEHS